MESSGGTGGPSFPGKQAQEVDSPLVKGPVVAPLEAAPMGLGRMEDPEKK